MKKPLVSAVGFLLCCGVIGVVSLFGYTRYKATQSANAQFSAELQSQQEQQRRNATLDAHMPAQLSSRPRPAATAPPAP